MEYQSWYFNKREQNQIWGQKAQWKPASRGDGPLKDQVRASQAKNDINKYD